MIEDAGKTGHHVRRARSLRRVALVVTGISSGLAVVAGLITWMVEQSADPMHRLGNAGWLSFPAGLVAMGGLVALLADVLVELSTGPATPATAGTVHQSAAPTRAGRPRKGMRRVVQVYAVYVFVGSLAMVGPVLTSEAGIVLGFHVLVLLGAGAFLWAVTHRPKPPARTAPGGHAGNGRTQGADDGLQERQELRRWGLAATGVGGGVTVTTYGLAQASRHLPDAGMPYGLFILGGFGLMLAVSGVFFLVVEALLHQWERRHD